MEPIVDKATLRGVLRRRNRARANEREAARRELDLALGHACELAVGEEGSGRIRERREDCEE